MPNITNDQLKDWLNLPDNELRDKLTELIPYVPKNIYLAPAIHPDYGDVHVVSTKVDHDGEVKIAVSRENEYAVKWVYIPIDDLTFTKPAEPATPINFGRPEWLETEEDYENAPSGTICAEPCDYPVSKSVTSWFDNFGDQLTAADIAGTRRRVLRWKWSNEGGER